MKGSMSRQAEAERERRSRVITAEGELQASEKLAQAAEVMTEHPAALQLRLLQTVVEVAAEKNSTLVLPFPVELLRFLERATLPETSIGASSRAAAEPAAVVSRTAVAMESTTARASTPMASAARPEWTNGRYPGGLSVAEVPKPRDHAGERVDAHRADALGR
jgi:hypothetical protein